MPIAEWFKAVNPRPPIKKSLSFNDLSINTKGYESLAVPRRSEEIIESFKESLKIKENLFQPTPNLDLLNSFEDKRVKPLSLYFNYTPTANYTTSPLSPVPDEPIKEKVPKKKDKSINTENTVKNEQEEKCQPNLTIYSRVNWIIILMFFFLGITANYIWYKFTTKEYKAHEYKDCWERAWKKKPEKGDFEH